MDTNKRPSFHDIYKEITKLLPSSVEKQEIVATSETDNYNISPELERSYEVFK